MRVIHRIIVSALIISKDGLILHGMKDPMSGGVYADCWHIPGGGVEEGEDEVATLIREIREETGIGVSTYDVCLIDDKGSGKSEKVLKETDETVMCHMKFHVYKVVLNTPADQVRISLNDDLVKYQWIDPSDLKKIKLTPPSIALFKRLGYIE